jgi:diguanylate cyclase (GGDEF)-like protein
MLRRKGAEVVEPTTPQWPTDPATGLPDRSNLEGWLTSAARTAQANSSRVALIFLELGNFSDVSDTYGPEVADQVLGTVGQKVMSALDPSQALCRYYGAELIVIFPNVNSVDRARDLAGILLDALSEPVPIGPGQVTTTCAAGVALSDTGYADHHEWLQDAHEALTEARREGHLAVVVHDEATRNRVDVRITQERVLKGWKQNEFYVMYQPIVRASDQSIAGFEALLRWRDPGASGTFISPAHFVFLLERLGLMVPVGAWILKEACHQVKQWNDRFADRDPMFVSVNLGARQIAQQAFANTVVAALDDAGLAPELLVLDVTEDCLRFNKGTTWNSLRSVKYLGVRIGLDDFGIGEVGLNYLRDLQLDFVSIHRSFMEGVGHLKEDTAIIEAVIRLGEQLGIGTIAEGIETFEQDTLARGMGPDYLQGFFYGRPELPENTLEVLEAGPTIVGSEDWKMAASMPEGDEYVSFEFPPDDAAGNAPDNAPGQDRAAE